MGRVLAILLKLGEGFLNFHFNLPLAIFGLLICLSHTGLTLWLLSMQYIPPEVGTLIIEFSMSGTLFLLVGVTVAATIPVFRRKKIDVSTKNTDGAGNVQTKTVSFSGGSDPATGAALVSELLHPQNQGSDSLDQIIDGDSSSPEERTGP